MASLREATPWRIKVPGKLVLSPLPVSYRAWRSLGIFRHGAMLSPDYARAVSRKHFERERPFHDLLIFSLDPLARKNP